MGVDIRLFLEFSYLPWEQHADGDVSILTTRVGSFSEGALSVARDRMLFRALAGSMVDKPPLYPPRGLPPYISEAVSMKFMLFVAEDGTPEAKKDGYVPRSEAARLVAEKESKYGGNGTRLRHLVSEPGYRRFSWLLLREIEPALA